MQSQALPQIGLSPRLGIIKQQNQRVETESSRNQGQAIGERSSQNIPNPSTGSMLKNEQHKRNLTVGFNSNQQVALLNTVSGANDSLFEDDKPR